MKIIGLTGSIGMGKSEVAKVFSAHGIPIFDSDAEVHKLYDSKTGAKLIETFVPEATRQGKVDRKIITEHILRDRSLLTKLETIVHAEIKQRRERFRKTQKSNLIVYDIPLLFETGADKEVDVTIVVSSPPEKQKYRVLQRPGMTEERFNMILARQLSDEEKRKRATIIIENNGTLEDLRSLTEAVIKTL